MKLWLMVLNSYMNPSPVSLPSTWSSFRAKELPWFTFATTEQNVCLVELNTLLTRFFSLPGTLPKYITWVPGEKLQKVQNAKSPKSHYRNRALSPRLTCLWVLPLGSGQAAGPEHSLHWPGLGKGAHICNLDHYQFIYQLGIIRIHQYEFTVTFSTISQVTNARWFHSTQSLK